ncbi:uncharacterized protein DUF4836 [Chitinophaga skermanii]|uniref:Uncharacterized protein DUF4836 n=1 Tax=Chitinophaga skermanii TaxID=331697 RepID=A0A327Q4R6_9BACT|nr:DUF4836 family protein [Chitinophaga skermanii]RAI98721.1 uncharacterized protein DUF4836 [Chitinophaga skermanii]
MKKKLSWVLLTALSAILVLSSCSKTPEQSKYIPKEASFVISLNSKQIEQKLINAGLSSDKVFENVAKAQKEATGTSDTSNPVMKGWKDAMSSGFDLKGSVYLFMSQSADKTSYFATIGKLKDATAFDAFIKKNLSGATFTKEGDITVGIYEDKGVVAWNNSTVIALMENPADKYAKAYAGDFSEDDFADSAATAKANTPITTSLKAEVTRLFGLKADQAVGTHESFKDIAKDNSDITAWVNYGAMFDQQMKNAPGEVGMMVAMVGGKAKQLVDGTFYTSAVNFEDGKIVAKFNTYMGKELTDIIKKAKGGGYDPAQIEAYPSTDVFGYLGYSFDLHVVGDILKFLGYDSLVDGQLAQAGLTTADVLNAFTGDISLVGSDFSVTKDTVYGSTKPNAKWMFTMKVGDKAAFEKVMSSPMVANLFTKEGDQYVPTQPVGEMGVSINTKAITVGSTKELVDSYTAGKGKIGMDNSILKLGKGKTAVAYVDIAKLLTNLPTAEMGISDSLATDMKNVLKDVKMTADQVSGNKQASVVELTFKNEKENSLAQIINLSMKAYKAIEEKKKADAAAWGSDAVVDSAITVEEVAVPAAPAH